MECDRVLPKRRLPWVKVMVSQSAARSAMAVVASDCDWRTAAYEQYLLATNDTDSEASHLIRTRLGVSERAQCVLERLLLCTEGCPLVMPRESVPNRALPAYRAIALLQASSLAADDITIAFVTRQRLLLVRALDALPGPTAAPSTNPRSGRREPSTLDVSVAVSAGSGTPSSITGAASLERRSTTAFPAIIDFPATIEASRPRLAGWLEKAPSPKPGAFLRGWQARWVTLQAGRLSWAREMPAYGTGSSRSLPSFHSSSPAKMAGSSGTSSSGKDPTKELVIDETTEVDLAIDGVLRVSCRSGTVRFRLPKDSTAGDGLLRAWASSIRDEATSGGGPSVADAVDQLSARLIEQHARSAREEESAPAASVAGGAASAALAASSAVAAATAAEAAAEAAVAAATQTEAWQAGLWEALAEADCLTQSWPPELAFRLYLELVRAVALEPALDALHAGGGGGRGGRGSGSGCDSGGDRDGRGEGLVPTSDEDQARMLPSLRALWPSLRIDARTHALARLHVTVEAYASTAALPRPFHSRLCTGLPSWTAALARRPTLTLLASPQVRLPPTPGRAESCRRRRRAPLARVARRGALGGGVGRGRAQHGRGGRRARRARNCRGRAPPPPRAALRRRVR